MTDSQQPGMAQPEKTDGNRKPVWPRIAGLAVALAALIVVAIYIVPIATKFLSDMSRVHDYIRSFGAWGVVVFMGLQVLQVVIAAIPGELTQVAGGYIYGAALGTVYSLAGIVVGSVIAFYLSRWLGFPILKRLVPASGLEKFSFLINSPKAEIGMLALFLIPGVPKDVLTFIAGLTPVRPVRFLLMTAVARLPGILISSLVGAHMEEKDYTSVVIVSAVALALFIAGVLLQDRVMKWVKSHHHAPSPPPPAE